MQIYDIWHWSTFIFLSLAGFWILLKLLRAYRLSGFRFYLYSALLLGLPFLIWALLFYYSTQAGIITFPFVFLVTRLGSEWAKDQEEIASEREELKWTQYQARISKQGRIHKILL
jgi:uncharacterized membrane protein